MIRTNEALVRFLQKCEELGKAPRTRRNYHGYLRHFADEYPELPLETATIEVYLRKRKETPAHRGHHFKCLQAFYSYLEMYESVKSPVPPKGKVGRPPKVKPFGPLVTSPPDPALTLQGEKLVRGGLSASTSTFISTAEIVEKYISFKVSEGVTGRTVEEYHGKLGAFARTFPTIPVDPDQIAKFLAGLEVDPLTRWDYRKHIVALYHFLERRKLIPEITKSFPRVKVPRKVRRVLSSEELTRLFDHTENAQERAILTLLIDAKIRASELCSLTRENLHSDHIVVTGKTGQRVVPINQQTYDLLSNLASEGFLFRVEGRPLRREYLGVRIKRLMMRAGLQGEKLGPHILRHSSSVQHIMHGGDLLSLKEELGHTTTRMTEQYAHLAEPEVKQKHAEVNVIGHIAPKLELRRAICFGCNLKIHVALSDVKTTECLRCHQVGKWYLPDTKLEELACIA